jgi:hypothetical protein
MGTQSQDQSSTSPKSQVGQQSQNDNRNNPGITGGDRLPRSNERSNPQYPKQSGPIEGNDNALDDEGYEAKAQGERPMEHQPSRRPG